MRLTSAFIALTATSQACKTQDGVIIGKGQDLKTIKHVKSVDDCCSECNKTGACVAFTYHTAGGDCWLHNGASSTAKEAGAVSGMRDGPLPPTPPPTPAPGWNACTGPKSASFKFCDTSLSIADRVADLAGRIDMDSAAGQLTARESPAFTDAELPSYYWGTNAIHGMQNVNCLSNGQCPTSFRKSHNKSM